GDNRFVLRGQVDGANIEGAGVHSRRDDGRAAELGDLAFGNRARQEKRGLGGIVRRIAVQRGGDAVSGDGGGTARRRRYRADLPELNAAVKDDDRHGSEAARAAVVGDGDGDEIVPFLLVDVVEGERVVRRQDERLRARAVAVIDGRRPVVAV